MSTVDRSRLERRYRTLLRVLPRWYRIGREEEMVSTFMADREDEHELEYSWPGWTETKAMITLSVRTRFAGSQAPPRAVATGAMVRQVALIGLLVHSVLTFSDLSLRLLTRPDAGIAFPTVPLLTGLGLATLVSFVMLLTGRRVLAKVFAVAGLAPGVIGLIMDLVDQNPFMASTFLFNLPLWFAVGCLFVGFHRDTAVPQAWPWLTAFGIGVVLQVGLPPVSWQLWIVPDSLTDALLVVGGAVTLVAVRRKQPGHLAQWALAMAAYLLVLLPARILDFSSLLEYRTQVVIIDSFAISTFAVAAVRLAVLLTMGTFLAIVGVRELRRLPAAEPPLHKA